MLLVVLLKKPVALDLFWGFPRVSAGPYAAFVSAAAFTVLTLLQVHGWGGFGGSGGRLRSVQHKHPGICLMLRVKP
jgi:hypothetical protein